MNCNKGISLCITFIFLIGCAASPASVKSVYVSPLKYLSYDCDQLLQEFECLDKKLAELNKKQGTASDIDAIAMGISAILFWPAAILIATSGDHSVELAVIKGEHKAIETFIIESKCSFADEIKITKEKRIKEEKERKERIQNRDW